MINQKGQTLIEILLASALLIILMPAIFAGIMTTREGRVQQEHRVDASYLLRETYEQVRVVRERGWDLFANNGTYHPERFGDTWNLAEDPETIDDLTRQVEISNVHRDENGSIVEVGTLDPSTKKVTITVSWEQPTESSIESTTYLTRYLENIAYTETTENDFLLGETVGTAVVNNLGGEVILSADGKGDWCRPNDFIVEELNLDHDARAKEVKAIEGKVFTGTDWADQGLFSEISVTQDDPPEASIISTFAGYDTNDIFIDENYAYIATDNVSKDIVIIDLNTNQEVGFYNDSFWWGQAQGVYVKDNVGYATIGPKLHTFDLSNKTGERPELDSVDLSPYWWWPATGYRLMVVGNYAFVALDFGNAEMITVNVANPSNISRAGSANVNSERGKDVFVREDGNRAYLVTDISGSKNELFVINTENKTGSMPVLGQYDSNGMNPNALAVVTENKLVLVGTGGEEYQVLDITNDNNPYRCGGIDVDSGIYGVAGVVEEDTDAFAYIVTKDADNELKIIEGGPSGSVGSEGTFESAVFDASYTTVFNRFWGNATIPALTDVSYQIAAADAVAGNCLGANYIFVGPDGTSSTFFTESSALPLDNDGVGFENPAQCFKYKVYLSTENINYTPTFEDISVNYSP